MLAVFSSYTSIKFTDKVSGSVIKIISVVPRRVTKMNIELYFSVEWNKKITVLKIRVRPAKS